MSYTIDEKFAREADDLDLNSFGQLPEGEYIGKFTEITYKEFATQSGYSIKFVVSDGAQAGMMSNIFIALKSANEMSIKYSKANLKKLFIAAGYNSVKTDLTLILNKKIRVEIKHTKKDGKTYTQISQIFENIYPNGRTTSVQSEKPNVKGSVPGSDYETQTTDVPW